MANGRYSGVILVAVLSLGLLIHSVSGQANTPIAGQGIDPVTANALSDNETVPVYLSVDLQKVVAVDEVKYSFTAYFRVVLTWRDPRVNATSGILSTLQQQTNYAQQNATTSCAKTVQFAGSTPSSDCTAATTKNSGCSKYCSSNRPTTCCDSIWLPSFTLTNVLFYSQDRFFQENIYFLNDISADGSAVDREVLIEGEFSNPMNFKKFPYDSQSLQVFIQSNSDNVKVIASASGRRIQTASGGGSTSRAAFATDEVTGWSIKNVTLDCAPSNTSTGTSTSTSYAPGDPLSAYTQQQGSSLSTPQSCVFSIDIDRLSDVYTVSDMLPVFFTVILSFSVFFGHPDALELRLTINVTLFLALVAVQFIIDSQLPRTSYLTAFGKFILTSYIFIFFIVIENIVVFLISSRREIWEREGRSKRLERQMLSLAEEATVGEEGEEGGEGSTRKSDVAQPPAHHPSHHLRRLYYKMFIDPSPTFAYKMASWIDRICLVILPLAYVITSIVLFS